MSKYPDSVTVGSAGWTIRTPICRFAHGWPAVTAARSADTSASAVIWPVALLFRYVAEATVTRLSPAGTVGST
jgi:hypothetical protein